MEPSGDSYVWVRVPALAAGSATGYIWMYYNNSTATDAQTPNTVWDENASNNFKAIWHLKEDPTATCSGSNDICDSTANAYNGTATGTLDECSANSRTNRRQSEFQWVK